VGVAYTLRAVQKAFFGEPEFAATSEHHEMEPISVPERIGAVILIVTSLLIGLFPRLLLDVIVPSFDSPLFDWLRKGGTP
jgi:NADH-quinone oxidoreductase subunit M